MIDMWYSPAAIRFTKGEMVFLIKNKEILARGEYPPDPKSSGYTDPPIGVKVKPKRAFFETPIVLHAELTWRLKKTKKHGKTLRDEVRDGYSFREMSNEARTTLIYISGWRRRKQSYVDWKRDVRRRDRNREKRG